MAVPSLSAVGADYVRDVRHAKALYRALCQTPDERLLEQRWLQVHWHERSARNLIQEASSEWNRHPEPLGEYLRFCWEHNYAEWHGMLDDYVLEQDPKLAAAIYQRFRVEGPTAAVQCSMLRLSYIGDMYALPMVGDMVRQGMAQQPSAPLLQLWYRFHPVCPISDRETVLCLSHCLKGPLHFDAVKVVERLDYDVVAAYIVQPLAHLAATMSNEAAHRARRILRRMSHCAHQRTVADAVVQTPFCEKLVTPLSMDCKFHLLAYLRDNQQPCLLERIFLQNPLRAVLSGVHTYLLELGCDGCYSACPFMPLVTCAHTALFHMCRYGTVLHSYMDELARNHRKAIARAAEFVPAIAASLRESKWRQRRVLMCALTRAAGVVATQDYEEVTQRLQSEGEWWSFMLLHRELWTNICVYYSD